MNRTLIDSCETWEIFKSFLVREMVNELSIHFLCKIWRMFFGQLNNNTLFSVDLFRFVKVKGTLQYFRSPI